MGCHRYEGYDKEPEDLTSIAQQMKLFEQQKIDNAKISADLMKQADSASSNDEANRFNHRQSRSEWPTARSTARCSSLIFRRTA